MVASITPKIQGASIVCDGSFNPSIFQPSWLASQELIRSEEAKAAEEFKGEQQLVITSELTVVPMGSMQLQVTRDRFVAAAVDATAMRAIQDLVVGVFELLVHTPIRRIAFFRHAHIEVSSREQWHALGDKLAPKEMWTELMETPGMRAVVVKGIDDGNIVHVKVEPSLRLDPGVYVEVSKQYASEADSAAWVSSMVRSSYDNFLNYSIRVVDRIILEVPS